MVHCEAGHWDAAPRKTMGFVRLSIEIGEFTRSYLGERSSSITLPLEPAHIRLPMDLPTDDLAPMQTPSSTRLGSSYAVAGLWRRADAAHNACPEESRDRSRVRW